MTDRIFNVPAENRIFSVSALSQELPVSEINHFIKDPAAIIDYTVRWLNWLDGDTISSFSWSIPTGIVNAGASGTTSDVKIWLASGTVGQIYELTNQIITATARQDERTISILIEDK